MALQVQMGSNHCDSGGAKEIDLPICSIKLCEESVNAFVAIELGSPDQKGEGSAALIFCEPQLMLS